MICPYCSCPQNTVKGGKTYLADSNADARVRICCDCGGEFLTAEAITHIVELDEGPKRRNGWKLYTHARMHENRDAEGR